MNIELNLSFIKSRINLTKIANVGVVNFCRGRFRQIQVVRGGEAAAVMFVGS
jgi:hypothetical protein